MSFANQTTRCFLRPSQNIVKLLQSVVDTSTDFRSTSKKLRTNVHFLHIVCENFSQENRQIEYWQTLKRKG